MNPIFKMPALSHYIWLVGDVKFNCLVLTKQRLSLKIFLTLVIVLVILFCVFGFFKYLLSFKF